MMNIKQTMSSPDDTNISTLATPVGYHDYISKHTGETYRISIENEPDNEPESEWESISLNPLVYPFEDVSMSYD